MEGLSDVTKSYLPLPTDPDASITPDITVPPFSKVPVPSALKLFVYLDTARPLSEPKWAKTGDVQDWLKSMFGRMFWVAGDAAEGWEKKIHVVDPDPVWFIYIKLFALYSTLFSLAPDNLDSSGWLVHKFPGRRPE